MDTSNTLLKYLAELIILDKDQQVKKDPDRAKKETYEALIKADQEHINNLVVYFNKKYSKQESHEAHP
jgi:hypothetical protein